MGRHYNIDISMIDRSIFVRFLDGEERGKEREERCAEKRRELKKISWQQLRGEGDQEKRR